MKCVHPCNYWTYKKHVHVETPGPGCQISACTCTEFRSFAEIHGLSDLHRLTSWYMYSMRDKLCHDLPERDHHENGLV